MRFLFAFALRIYCHQFDMYTMCRSRVITEYVFLTISVNLTTIVVIFLESAGIIAD